MQTCLAEFIIRKSVNNNDFQHSFVSRGGGSFYNIRILVEEMTTIISVALRVQCFFRYLSNDHVRIPFYLRFFHFYSVQ